MSRQGDGSRSSADQGQRKSTKTMIFLDDLGLSGPTHPLFPIYLNPKSAATIAATINWTGRRTQRDRVGRLVGFGILGMVLKGRGLV